MGFTSAENTTQSITLGFGTHLPGNFNTRVTVLLLRLVSLSSFCKNSLDGFAPALFYLTWFPHISLCTSSLPAPVRGGLWILCRVGTQVPAVPVGWQWGGHWRGEPQPCPPLGAAWLQPCVPGHLSARLLRYQRMSRGWERENDVNEGILLRWKNLWYVSMLM